jgi:hypothetical protein
MRKLIYLLPLLCSLCLAQGFGGKAGIGGKAGFGGGVAGGGGSAAPVFNAAGTPCDSSAGTCTVTQSIASGHLIVAYVKSVTGTYTSFSVADSNSDSFSNCTKITDAGGGREGQLFYAVAGASITTITLTVVGQTSGDLFLLPVDYTNPAGLTTGTILDQCLPASSAGGAGQNENTTSWSTGASSPTTNATDLVTAFFWTNAFTYTVGGSYTSRATNCCSATSLIEDFTTSSTGAQTATATLSGAAYGPGVGAAFK